MSALPTPPSHQQPTTTNNKNNQIKKTTTHTSPLHTLLEVNRVLPHLLEFKKVKNTEIVPWMVFNQNKGTIQHEDPMEREIIGLPNQNCKSNQIATNQ